MYFMWRRKISLKGEEDKDLAFAGGERLERFADHSSPATVLIPSATAYTSDRAAE